MRKIISFLLFLYCFLFLLTGLTSAQGLPIPGFGDIPVPGKHCGNAESTVSAYRKCCKSIFSHSELNQKYSLVQRALSGIGNLGLPGISDFADMILQVGPNMDRAINVIPCPIGYPYPNKDDPQCVCRSASQITPTPLKSFEEICKTYVDKNIYPGEYNQCVNVCAPKGGVWTAVGCIYGDFSRFIIENVFGLGLGFGGIATLFCIIYASMKIQTSRDNSTNLTGAKDILISCIIGLLVVIFSVFIFRVIGYDVLRIPFIR